MTGRNGPPQMALIMAPTAAERSDVCEAAPSEPKKLQVIARRNSAQLPPFGLWVMSSTAARASRLPVASPGVKEMGGFQ